MSVETARKVLRIEADAVRALVDRIGEEFERAVDLVYACRGKVIVTGIGKSGLVCQKIAATLAGTGTPAIFLHAAEGLHGDLGVVARSDLVVAISNSGETEELLGVIPVLKRIGVKLIAITGNLRSTLASQADIVLDAAVAEEACPMNLAPTASTTATVALGDALAIAVLERRGFKEEDFALLHPGGTLGRKLLLRVGDVMHSGEAVPLVDAGAPMKEVVLQITSKRFGVTGVRGEGGRLVGVITDGDLRRGIERSPNLLDLKAGDVMTRDPKTIRKDELAAAALRRMEELSITSLFVVDGSAPALPVGILHMHDLLRAGVV